jgi:ferredoxin/flavodoxin---NADP+ reductase
MSYPILSKESIAENTYSAEILAPHIARSRKSGQFVMICIHREYCERVPLTIVDSDPEKGSIRLIWQTVGKTTAELSDMEVGDEIDSVTGPLGRPTVIEHFGTVICVGGGVGNAALLPIAKALKEANNTVVSILGAKTKDLLILESEFGQLSDELIITTDDGSYGQKALVIEPLGKVCQKDQQPDMVFAIGPAIMMKSCCEVTKRFGIPTQVSLNTIMVCGIGMCGSCRVEVDGQTRFVCIDGPEFDGHEVNYDLMMGRLGAYRDQERRAYEDYRKHKFNRALAAIKS